MYELMLLHYCNLVVLVYSYCEGPTGLVQEYKGPLASVLQVSCEKAMADEDIVISGFSAYFPQADHLVEFREKLYAGVDMVTEDDLRWPPGAFSSLL
ncbi:hypothetical protein HPB50_005759 [Hyalomma asiaticum]|uniref:Uncharacterized protein n=1 Tax=Hyalomma asiaticum TaxID=266040 RepID=A0ACB7T835_HYAAI|nr:hypothetical protein HPB50_005759 [Hyalomma asiaticum]